VKSQQSETSNFGLRFFEITLQKTVKSGVFLDFQKNVKNVFSNYGSGLPFSSPAISSIIFWSGPHIQCPAIDPLGQDL